MKHHIFYFSFAIFFLQSFNLLAQKKGDVHLTLLLHGGLSNENIPSDGSSSAGGDTKYKFTPAYSVGVRGTYYFVDELFVKSGIEFLNIGMLQELTFNHIKIHQNDPSIPIKSENTFRTSWVSVPMLIGVNVSGGNRGSFSAALGIDNLFSVNKTSNVEVFYSNRTTSVTEENGTLFEEYKTAATLELSSSIYLSKILDLNLGFKGSYFLSPIPFYQDDSYPYWGGLSLGLTYKL